LSQPPIERKLIYLSQRKPVKSDDVKEEKEVTLNTGVLLTLHGH